MSKPYLVEIRPCVDKKTIRRSVYRSLQHGHPQLMPRGPQGTPIAIVASGPSAADHIDQIRAHQAQGFPVMSLAGMHKFLIERGVVPSFHAMMDPRERTAAYIDPPHPDVAYLIASQCHDAVFAKVKGHNAFVWHVEASAKERLILEAATDHFVHIRTGCTIGMGALSLAVVLGHKDLHLYGYDGCFIGDKHHAHEEHNTKAHKMVMLAGRKFLVDKWMGGQASDFQKVLDVYRSQLNIKIHGDGLLAYIAELKQDLVPNACVPDLMAEIVLIEAPEEQLVEAQAA